MITEHAKRVWVALIAVPLLFFLYFYFGHSGLVAMTVLVSTASYYEFLSFSGAAKSNRGLATLVGFALSLWLCLDAPAPLAAIYISALAILAKGLWRVHTSAPEELSLEFHLAKARVFGLTYMVLFPSFIPRIHSLPNGAPFLLLLLGVIWIGDTAAYYGGKTLGRRKLSLNISPGKTIEGAVVAIFACILWAIAVRHFWLAQQNILSLCVASALTSIVAQAGDLLESLMKRAYKVKDSSGLIPGHGGVFDRFDSLIFSAPFFYILVRLLS